MTNKKSDDIAAIRFLSNIVRKVVSLVPCATAACNMAKSSLHVAHHIAGYYPLVEFVGGEVAEGNSGFFQR